MTARPILPAPFRAAALGALAALALLAPLPALAQQGPLRIEITEGVIEPIPIAIPTFLATTPEAQAYAEQITRVVAADLVTRACSAKSARGPSSRASPRSTRRCSTPTGRRSMHRGWSWGPSRCRAGG